MRKRDLHQSIDVLVDLNADLTTKVRELRIPVLAIALMLKNRADAMDVDEGSHVKAVLAEYDRVHQLHALLGPTTDEESAAALALWDETAA